MGVDTNGTATSLCNSSINSYTILNNKDLDIVNGRNDDIEDANR
jgi:hypothetical protein